jgi:hypothetical protein
MDKETLKDYLLVPGEERLMLIDWALSELNIVANKRGNTFFTLLLNSLNIEVVTWVILWMTNVPLKHW